ncbi:MAG: hypothetical protein GY950_20445 [bacterium]|nr:hypothetical protein [bacterium]
MGFSNTYLSNYLEDTRVTFDNLPNLTQFRIEMGQHGYDDTRFQHGADLHKEFGTDHHLYLDTRQSAKAKGKEMTGLFEKIFSIYMAHVKRLKIEFAYDPDILSALGLKGSRDRTRAGVVVQITNFYNAAVTNTDVFNKLTVLGYTAENLDAESQDVRTYQTVRADHEKLYGDCQEFVQKRDAAFKKLRDWMNAFIATAKFAYRDNLQALEKAGIFIRNRPKRKPKEKKPADDTTDTTDPGTATTGA